MFGHSQKLLEKSDLTEVVWINLLYNCYVMLMVLFMFIKAGASLQSIGALRGHSW